MIFVVSGKDVMAKAKTGTGKTVAFLVNGFVLLFHFLFINDHTISEMPNFLHRLHILE